MLAAGDPDETPKEASRSNWPIRRRIDQLAKTSQFGGSLPTNWLIRRIGQFDLTVRPEIGAHPELQICNRHTQQPEVYDTRLERSRQRWPKARN
jgi:hypothetical protein